MDGYFPIPRRTQSPKGPDSFNGSIYILPYDPINDKKLKLIEQIPKLHILLGDLNSHNIIWGCLQTNKKGTDLEKVINSNNLCILNDKSPTYLNPSTGSYSAIDITLILQAT